MFAMINQLFASITVFFVAFGRIANATNHLSGWAEESAGAFADEARIQRATKLNALEKELAISNRTTTTTTAKPLASVPKAKAKPAVAKVA